MDIKTAMGNIKQAVYAFNGNRGQHEVLEQSLRVIEDALQPKPEAPVFEQGELPNGMSDLVLREFPKQDENEKIKK